MIAFSVKEPPCEDTEQELKERVHRSALSAVDLEKIKHTFSTVRIPCILTNQIPDLNTCVCSLGERMQTTTIAKSDLAAENNYYSRFTFGDSSDHTPFSPMDKSTFERPSQTFTSPVTYQRGLLLNRLHGQFRFHRQP